MANIDLKLSSKEDKVTHRSEILIRFYQGQKIDYRVKSGLFVEPRISDISLIVMQVRSKVWLFQIRLLL